MSMGLNKDEMSAGDSKSGAGQDPEDESQVDPAKGQEPQTVDEWKALTGSLRKEAAKHRTGLRAAEKKQSEIDKAKADAEEAAALKRGEYEKLLATEKQKNQDLEKRLSDVLLNSALKDDLRAAGVLDAAIADVLAVFPRKDLKLTDDGKVEGSTEAIAAFKTAKPWFFGAQQAIGGNGAKGSGGLPGYNPKGHQAADETVPITDKLRKEADERGLKVEDMAHIEWLRQRQRSGTPRA